MKTTITITQKNMGDTPGSVGWLANSTKSVKFGEARSGKRAAFLTIGDTTENVLTKGFEWCPYMGFLHCDGIGRNTIKCGNSLQDVEPTFGVNWTDSAWSAFDEMLDLIEEKFREWLQDEQKITFKIVSE